MEIEGSVKLKKELHQVSDKFKKQEIVVTTDETYPQHILIEFQQEKCDLLNKANIGDKVKVSINIRGREWQSPQGETKYFNSIQGWRIEVIGNSAPVSQPAPAQVAPAVSAAESDDLPF